MFNTGFFKFRLISEPNCWQCLWWDSYMFHITGLCGLRKCPTQEFSRILGLSKILNILICSHHVECLYRKHRIIWTMEALKIFKNRHCYSRVHENLTVFSVPQKPISIDAGQRPSIYQTTRVTTARQTAFALKVHANSNYKWLNKAQASLWLRRYSLTSPF